MCRYLFLKTGVQVIFLHNKRYFPDPDSEGKISFYRIRSKIILVGIGTIIIVLLC